jgi:hypothetical protein
MSASQLEEEIRNTEENMNSLGDMSTYQQLELQDTLQIVGADSDWPDECS